MQIYDPVTDTWSLGAEIPFNAGSPSTALINNMVYVCGGIDEDIKDTVDTCARYDWLADSWDSNVADMPDGVNHAASATDGQRMYVFGGRKGQNRVGDGFDFTQIYDPLTDTWETSEDDSAIEPLPAPRGGTGRALYLPEENVFLVVGGESN